MSLHYKLKARWGTGKAMPSRKVREGIGNPSRTYREGKDNPYHTRDIPRKKGLPPSGWQAYYNILTQTAVSVTSFRYSSQPVSMSNHVNSVSHRRAAIGWAATVRIGRRYEYEQHCFVSGPSGKLPKTKVNKTRFFSCFRPHSSSVPIVLANLRERKSVKEQSPRSWELWWKFVLMESWNWRKNLM